MDVLYFLLPISLLLSAIAICFFFWGVKQDQYDDLDSPAKYLLFQDQDLEQGKSKDD